MKTKNNILEYGAVHRANLRRFGVHIKGRKNKRAQCVILSSDQEIEVPEEAIILPGQIGSLLCLEKIAERYMERHGIKANLNTPISMYFFNTKVWAREHRVQSFSVKPIRECRQYPQFQELMESAEKEVIKLAVEKKGGEGKYMWYPSYGWIKFEMIEPELSIVLKIVRTP